mmetsp:Transcript_559/g.609  ORF Transcript_559/g.609 Transcript_559/m.609 type:complete len:88 (-) Transcript_559:188-451(-)
MTPRTCFLYAFGETPSNKLDKLPELLKETQSNSNLINFAEERRSRPLVPSQFKKAPNLKSNYISLIKQQDGAQKEPSVMSSFSRGAS